MLNLFNSALLRFAPGMIVRTMNANSTKAMLDNILQLEIISAGKAFISGQQLRTIELKRGPRMIGMMPNKIEKKMVGSAARTLGLDASYSKVLLDAITRYQFAHAAIPILRLNHPAHQRMLFHPQHQNFVAEDSLLNANTKLEIADIFAPQPGWHILDIGAFMGHGALWLRNRIGSNGKMICVEANPVNHTILQEQLRLNAYHNVSTRNAAIWNSEGSSVPFTITNRQANAVDQTLVGSGNQVEIQTTTIQKLTEELGRPADLVSLTVNGAEVEAIEGLKKMSPINLPRRILAPGWYKKDGVQRIQLLGPMLENLGYTVHTTTGGFAVGYRNVAASVAA